MNYARLRIDCDALVANYRFFCDRAEGEVAAVVKANAYGLGAMTVVERLHEVGCRSFFVATIDEAEQIRSLVKHNLFVFEPPDTCAEFIELASMGCTPVVNTTEQLEFSRANPSMPVAVQIDTGMERLGIPATSVDIETLRDLNIKLLMTHLACADDPDDPFNQVQVDRFKPIAESLPNVRTSIGNSAATITGAPFQGDVCRPGIGLYGASPFSKLANPLKIVARCEARVLDVRHLQTGTRVGYSSSYTVQRPTRLAVVGMGYADGIPHVLSNAGHLAFHDKLLPIRGRISMDMTQVDATECEELKVGDWVEFFGDSIDVDDVAKTAKSFSYEFLTGIGSRVIRQYV